MKPTQISDVAESLLNEWKRGMLTFWTLSLLLNREMYGLEIKKEIETSTRGKMKLGVSTIYPLLRRLEKRGLVSSRWEATTQGPPRAYYSTSPQGKVVVKRFVEDVLSPASPIYAALGELTGNLMELLNSEEIRGVNIPGGKNEED